jgi:DNA-directed RNA polymerase specialized sigma24 family protein
MARLPEDKREQIKRLLLEGLSPAEVAKKVGVSLGTAERHQQYWAPEIRDSLNRRMVPTLKAAIRREKRK